MRLDGSRYDIHTILPPVKRIALLSVHTSPVAALGGRKSGGMNVMVRALAETFGQRGVQVDVYTRVDSIETVGKIAKLGPNARLIYLPAGPPQYLDPEQIYEYVREFVGATLAFAAAHSLHYDLLYSHYWISGAVALQLREAWQIPIVQMFHTLGQMKQRIANVRDASPNPTLIPAQMSQRVAVESMVMQTAERLIAATHAERVQMLLLYRADRRRIEVVPPGVDLQRFHPIDRQQAKHVVGLDQDARLLLSVGRIERLKGIDVVCKALAILKERCPEEMTSIRYYVIGGDLDSNSSDNNELQHLRELCTSLGLDDMIDFVGAKGHGELLNYYNAADALIMPSDYESFGMVALEAMACGTPVIASEVGGLAFLVKDGVTGYHIPTREPEALAERIFWLLTDKRAWQQMSQAAHQAATTYSWNRIADKLMEIFIDATLEKATRPQTL